MNKKDNRWRTDAVLWEKLVPIAREMRRKPTEAENSLWQCLRNRQLLGFRFRRQHSIDRFIVDFYCAKARLVIEVDGEVHQYRAEEDLIRQEYLESYGLKIIRFSNDAVLNNVNEVVKQILTFLTSPPLVPPLRQRRGG
jgi:very-short-patch-repair endonuclease